MSANRAKYAGDRPTVSGGTAERPSAATHDNPSPKTLQRFQVPFGLLCVQVGFITTALVMLCVIAVAWWFKRDIAKVAPLILVLNFAGFAASLITMGGKLLCLTAPPQMPGKCFIVFAVLIDLLALSLCITAQSTVLPPPLAASINLLSVAAFVCFVLFLRQLGHFLGNSEIAGLASGTRWPTWSREFQIRSWSSRLRNSGTRSPSCGGDSSPCVEMPINRNPDMIPKYPMMCRRVRSFPRNWC